MDLKEILLVAGLEEMAKVAVSELVEFFKGAFEKNIFEKTWEPLQDYLMHSYENNALMHTIVFRGIEKNIFDLYIPLTLCYE